MKEEYLTATEIDDVEAGLKEIKRGHARKFSNVEEFLKELKEGD